MILSKVSVGLAACLIAHGSAQEVAVPTPGQECDNGVCGAHRRPGAEHLLLQVTHRMNLTQSAAGTAGGELSSDCGKMPDVKQECGWNCKVLAGQMWGKTCADYCAKSGLQCVWAAEEVNDDCQVKQNIDCHTNADSFHTSDLLCQCERIAGGGGNSGGGGGGGGAQDQLVWSDEFDGNSVDRSKWGFETGGGGYGNNELQHYTDRWANAHVDGGSLKIVAKCERYGNEHFTSAKLTTQRTATWGPGHRVEVRARFSTNQGTWPAIWMLPRDSAYGGWPKSGEMDIMEAVGCTPGKVFGTVHTEAYNHRIHTEKQGVRDTDGSQWHVYALEWTQNRLVWTVDGQVMHTFSPPDRSHDKWPFDQQFYLILNVAVGGSWGGWCLSGGWPSCDLSYQFARENSMEVDFARVYKIGGSWAQEAATTE